jgi:Holliday junction resolvasome RuvABC endonuclease subunit
VKTILALDLGTKTGYALHNGAIISGVWDLKPGRFEGGGMRFLKFRNMLAQMHTASPISEVYFEEVRRHAGTDAAHVYGGLMGQLTAWCEERKIPYQGVPVGAIKKSWTGNGAAKKDLMIQTARDHGFTPIDDNEADALALLDMKLKEMVG